MKNSFTLIEVLIVLAIIALVAVLSVPFYQSFQVRTQLDDQATEIAETLRKAQSKAMASEDNQSFGVHFESDKFVLFEGTSYDSNDSNNEVFDLPNTLSLSINLNGGGSDVVFDKVKGTTSDNGTLSLSSVNNETRTIEISPAGKIEY